MTTFTVVQYVPDPIADERINVGLIAANREHVAAKFVDNWERIERFGGEDPGFLRDFAAALRPSLTPELFFPTQEPAWRLDEDRIAALAGSWVRSIQFTDPRPTVLSPGEFVVRMAHRFLREHKRIKRGYRSRAAAASVARRAVRSVLEERIGNRFNELYRANALLRGRFDEHCLDAVVENGHPQLAAHGLSFELPEARVIDRSLDSLAWTVDDIRKRDTKLPLVVVALEPQKTLPGYDDAAKSYERAERILTGLGAAFHGASAAEQWLRTTLSGIQV